MKGKYLPIIALSLAIVLVGTVAYASDKRKKEKLLDFELRHENRLSFWKGRDEARG